ncbi:MAG TPA: CHASE2 domain-containing protein [Candidatus Methylomirabilis sp.]|nr:CHASE2 domain-containing protein [Candidatus Methylomirabilis sp.]
MPTIFISYRRDDSIANAGRLFDWLSRQFGRERVFLDTEKIASGDRFAGVLEERLGATDVLLAVIGPKWLTIADGTGRRRIDDPADFVVFEVATALARGIRVIPVLVGGARIPKAAELPAGLQALAGSNALSIDDTRFAGDFETLVDDILGRPRGYARRELDRLRRVLYVGKVTSLVAPVVALAGLLGAWVHLFDVLTLDTKVASYAMWLDEVVVGRGPETPLVLVAIDDATEQRLGRPYAPSEAWRADHARLIEQLAAAGARSVVFDLFLQRETGADGALAGAIAAARQRGTRVILGAREVADGRPRMAPRLLDAGAEWGILCIGRRLGYAFTVPLAVAGAERPRNPALSLVAVHDGTLVTLDRQRRELVLIRHGEAPMPVQAGFSTMEPVRSTQRDCPTLEKGDAVATLMLRTSPAGFWRDPARRLSYADVIAPQGPPRLEGVRGKTVLVGVATGGSRDVLPMVRGFTRSEVLGVELHADAIANLQSGRVVHPMGTGAQFVVMLFLALAGAVTSFWIRHGRRLWRAVAFVGVGAAYLTVNCVAFAQSGLLLNYLYDAASFSVAYGLLSHLQARLLRAPDGEGST